MAYSNDGYKHKNQFNYKKGSTVHQVSAEDSVNKMLKKKIGFDPEKKSAVNSHIYNLYRENTSL